MDDEGWSEGEVTEIWIKNWKKATQFKRWKIIKLIKCEMVLLYYNLHTMWTGEEEWCRGELYMLVMMLWWNKLQLNWILIG